MMITCSSTPDISLHESLYHPQHPWVRILHQMNVKNVLQRNWMKSKEKSQDFEAYQEETPVCRQEEDNLAENLQCTAEAWWRFPIKHQDDYSVDQISWWQKKCHMDMFHFSNYDILYCLDLHEAFTVFQTKVHLKSIITLSMMKSRKEKMILQYISPQRSR